MQSLIFTNIGPFGARRWMENNIKWKIVQNSAIKKNENQRQGFLLTLVPVCLFRPGNIRAYRTNEHESILQNASLYFILLFCYLENYDKCTLYHSSTLQCSIVGGTSTKCINNNFISTEMLEHFVGLLCWFIYCN